MGSGPRNQPVQQPNGHSFSTGYDSHKTKQRRMAAAMFWLVFGREGKRRARAVHFDTDKRQVNCYTTLYSSSESIRIQAYFPLTFSPVYYAVIFNLSPPRSLRNSFVKKFQIKRRAKENASAKKNRARTSEE